MEAWGEGEAYERYVGRWSRLVARAFVAWLDPAPGLRWIDVGCGTGALVEALLERAAPAQVTGVDRWPGFIADVRARIDDPRVRLEQGDALALPLEDAAYDACVSGLVLNFVADHAGAVREMRRVVRPGGAVALYVWDYGEGMQLMRRFWDAARALDPAAADLDQGQRFPICRPEALAVLLRGAGLTGVTIRAIDTPTVFRDFDDFWQPFLGRQGAAPAYVASLSDAARARLRERLRADLPIDADGSIRLTARAFAARATVPRARVGLSR